jgi:hypothetical protein
MSIKLSDQSIENKTCTVVKVALVIGLDNLMDTIQRSHHNIRLNNIVLCNYWLVHYLGSGSYHITLCPLSDSTLWTASRHDYAKITNKVCQKYFQKY